jgi:hypothetical protein
MLRGGDVAGAGKAPGAAARAQLPFGAASATGRGRPGDSRRRPLPPPAGDVVGDTRLGNGRARLPVDAALRRP